MTSPVADGALSRTSLLRMRWFALGIQALAIVVAAAAGLHLPLLPMLTVMGVVALSNLGLAQAAPRWIPGFLILDTLALTSLLALSGGPSNPFTSLYLVHVALAAVILDPIWTWGIAALSAVGFASLFMVGNPHLLHSPDAADLHLYGMWLALTLTGAGISFFVARLSTALRRREQELAALLQNQVVLQEAQARAEKLNSLATLAAGAAHEMGTPLSTIAVATRELEAELEGDERQMDLRLIREQVERCREILAQMAEGAGQSVGEVPERVTMERLWTEVRKGLPGPLQEQVHLLGDGEVRVPPRVFGRLLASLARNSLQAGSPEVWVRRVEEGFRVEDQGTGMTPEQLSRVGEPFFTTRRSGHGMGLGLFLARNVVQTLGGSLQIHSQPGKGTTVELKIP